MNAETGNSIWRLLHAYADQYPVEPDEQAINGALSFLNTFGQIVLDRSYGCACHNEWQKLVAKHPAPLHTRAELQKWCIATHDWINQKLNRKLYMPAVSQSHVIFTNPV